MKKLSAILFAALLVVGLGSCERESSDVQPQPTSLTLAPTEVTLKVGATQQLTATVEPTDQTYTVTFTSDNEQVATVNAKGLVTAVAEGTANITAKIGDLTAKSVVTVSKDDNGGTVTETNELPLLMFDATADNNSVTNQEVLDYEAKIGRTAQAFKIWDQGPFAGGFVNKDLTIMGVVYGLSFPDLGEWVIPAFSKESLANCPKTMAMLAKYGFTNFEEGKDKDNKPFKTSVCDNDPSISVELADDPNDEIGSTLMLLFSKPMPKQDIQTFHDILPNAKDFPSYTTVLTKDIAKIKEFETTLGLREYNAEKSKEDLKNLIFLTKEASIPQSNFLLVYYVCTPEKGTPFINSVVNCIKNEQDFEDSKLKEWFTTNGYGNNFEASAAKGYASGTDATGKIMAQIFISENGAAALLQIGEKPANMSATQMRSLAMKQHQKMQPLSKTQHRKLHQARRR